MSMLPRVTDPTRERISREFDNLGPDVCMADIRKDLDRHNPQLLDMAMKLAGEGKEAKKLFTASGCFIDCWPRRRRRLSNPRRSVRCLRFLPKRATGSLRASPVSATSSSAGKRSPILKRQIPNSCRWRTALRRCDQTTRARCRHSPCFMRRSSSSRRAIGSSLTSSAPCPRSIAKDRESDDCQGALARPCLASGSQRPPCQSNGSAQMRRRCTGESDENRQRY